MRPYRAAVSTPTSSDNIHGLQGLSLGLSLGLLLVII